jgi:hypothetical protein
MSVDTEYGINPAAEGGPASTIRLPNQGFKSYDGAANQMYNIGVDLGNIEQRGNWRITYNYKTIEEAATWNGMVDDDFGYNGLGGANVRGHHIKAWYRLYDPLTLSFSYFMTEAMNTPAGARARQDRFFMDLIWAF